MLRFYPPSFVLKPRAIAATALILLAAQCIADSDKMQEEIIVVDRPNMATVPDDTTGMLRSEGVNFFSAGGLSQLPVIRGLNDDRVRVLVDGAETTSACANHMNPALSYVDASRIAEVNVVAGITPVSMGGDSIAGTIMVASEPPRYATESTRLLKAGSLAWRYKSNDHNQRVAANAVVASQSFSLTYSGSGEKADSYKDGRGEKVVDTLYQAENHSLTAGVRQQDGDLTIRLKHQKVPYQGFPNQYMDMVDNESRGANIQYRTDRSWGQLEVRTTWQDVTHAMGFFTEEKTGAMPMLTEGRDLGYQVRVELPWRRKHILRLGHEYHYFSLDDWWPAVAGSSMMGPADYININDGERRRLAVFAELDYQLGQFWSTQLGLRAEQVETDAGDAQSYNTMSMMGSPNLDAAAAEDFNARERNRQDDNIDLTALLRYQPAGDYTVEFGYGRKTRSPNLYERYSWGRSVMASTMVGWFGDANGYVGDIDLRPEVAHTVSASLIWRGSQQTELSITPYYTRVNDYIDVVTIGTFNPRMVMQETRAQLQFTNLDVELHGVDIKGRYTLNEAPEWGRFDLGGRLGYTRGQRTDGGGNLYQIMPLNFNVTLEHSIARWSSVLEAEWVDRKDNLDSLRMEKSTESYTLVNLETRYSIPHLTITLGALNLLDRYYELPLGGVNYAGWKFNGMSGPLQPLSGQGRSLVTGIQYRF